MASQEQLLRHAVRSDNRSLIRPFETCASAPPLEQPGSDPGSSGREGNGWGQTLGLRGVAPKAGVSELTSGRRTVGLEAAERGYRPNGLACDRGDHIKVAVVVANRKTGDISAGGDQKIRNFDLTLSSLDNQFTPYVHRPIPTVLPVGDLR